MKKLKHETVSQKKEIPEILVKTCECTELEISRLDYWLPNFIK
jgi:hypothetical protein